ncbi:MAG: glucose 1-dehydrogenase [Alphaproteobacteria bacterium]|nr:glucose 1-dehydrogenase [Alphaproteobacteria bacterium]MDP6590257.1 glucose 1-dehydrogenase [Alphaproteobacteria bacterium]MDP6817360.1 glucose 1-dehydrogenase [Alphaproteobacteria bacterium]
MAGRVAGKTALVSGAATGIGQSVARRLAIEGARVAVADIDERRGAEVVAAIREAGCEAMFISLDVTEEAAWQAAIGAVESAFGGLDILVNNAGIAIIESVDKMSFKDWRAVMAVNIDGVFLGTKHAVPAMRRAGGGSIVNISSILGLTGEEKASAYSASKGAVRLFTKAVALECGRDGSGIRVNSIHPGYIHTAMMEETCRRDYGDIRTGLAELGKLHPIGRVGEPEEIAAGVLYLASDESKFVTGSELAIDGGYTAA